MVRKPRKKYQKTEYTTDSESKNKNENTPDNSNYEIKEIEGEEQNLGKKDKQQTKWKTKTSKKGTLKFFNYLNNDSQDAKKNSQWSSACNDCISFLTASLDCLPSSGLHQNWQTQPKKYKK